MERDVHENGAELGNKRQKLHERLDDGIERSDKKYEETSDIKTILKVMLYVLKLD